jgi:hypothetical protein
LIAELCAKATATRAKETTQNDDVSSVASVRFRDGFTTKTSQRATWSSPPLAATNTPTASPPTARTATPFTPLWCAPRVTWHGRIVRTELELDSDSIDSGRASDISQIAKAPSVAPVAATTATFFFFAAAAIDAHAGDVDGENRPVVEL